MGYLIVSVDALYSAEEINNANKLSKLFISKIDTTAVVGALTKGVMLVTCMCG